MYDPIDRYKAIDALCDNCDNMQAVCAHYPCKQYIAIEQLSSAPSERLTNKQWKDFLSEQFNISRESAKGMLHIMMQWKQQYDYYNKMFNGGQK